jgi:hypothetical protein
MAKNQGVKPEVYINSMRDRWKQLGMAYNQPLQEAWHDMADTFNRHIRGDASEEWNVLQLPTGSGKTQGLAVYCAELTKLKQHPGILIITRFTKEADKLAATINKLAEQDIAQAHHSDNEQRAKSEELPYIPILIITHSRYSNILSTASVDDLASSWSWDMYYRWKDGSRKLTIIDETLNTTEHIKIEFDELHRACALPIDLEEKYPRQQEYLNELLRVFKGYAQGERAAKYIPLTAWNNKVDGGAIVKHDLKPLIAELSTMLPNKKKVKGNKAKKDAKFKKTTQQRQAEMLEIFSDMISQDCIYARVMNSRALHKAVIPLPTQIKNAVILDATAGQNYVYGMLGKFVDIRSLPQGIRNYQHVTLNVMYGLPVGKGSLPKQSSEFFLGLTDTLSPSIAGKRTLFCVHLDAEEKFQLVKEQHPKAKVAHWGEIDGKNDWEKFEAVVLCGLPFIGRVNAECAVMAFEAWHRKTGEKYNPDVFHDDETMTFGYEEDDGTAHNHYDRSHITVGVIQAINRVHCRRSIDDAGNCQQTEVHLFLHRQGGGLETHLLDGIRQAMPGIKVVESDVPVIAAPEKLSNKEEHVIEFFKKKQPGEYLAKEIYEKIKSKHKETKGITKRTLQRCIQAMQQEPECLVSRRMQEMKISYISEMGQHGRSRFIKAA